MADAFPPPRTPSNKWHGGPGDPTIRTPKSNRGRQLYWLTALSLALLGAVAAIVFYPKPMTQPRFLSMTVREYRSPLLPPNAWALQDGKLLARHFEGRTEEFYDKQSRDTFDKFLTRLESGDGPMVVHLGALGRVAGDDVVLFLVDTDVDQQSRGIPLKEILKRMTKGAAHGERLLLLDLARPVADAHLGILADNLAEAVDRELTLAELPFHVLTACSAGQMSHVSEELGASAFAYHLDLAMRGLAETAPDRRITVHELADFATKYVDRWVWVNRGQRQTPRLYGKAKDFALVQLDSVHSEMPAPPGEKPYAPWLQAGWKERDELFQSGAYRWSPWAFRRLELALVRAEKRWRSGDGRDVRDGKDDDSRLRGDLEIAVRNFKDEIVKARDLGGPPKFSLAEIEPAKTDVLSKELPIRLDKHLSKIDPTGKVDESDKARVDEAKKAKAELLEELTKAPFDAAAAAVVAAAERPTNLTAARIAEAVGLLAAIREKAPAARRCVEIVYLDRLKDLIEPVRESGIDIRVDWQGTIAHQALRTQLKSAEILALIGKTPSGFDPWTKSLVVEGEKHRRRGDKDLFAGVDFSWREAQAAYAQADTAYRGIPRRLEILRSMQAQRDQAFVLAPGWGPYLIALPRPDRQDLDLWQEGVRAARDLADVLQRKDPSILDTEPTVLARWQDCAGRWQRLIDVRLQRINRSVDDAKAGDYLEWTALLESSGLSADQRAAVWANARKLGLKLLRETPPPGSAESELIVPGDDPTARWEVDRKNRRVRQTLDLFDLAAYAGRPDDGDAGKLQATLLEGVLTEFIGYVRSEEPLADRLVKADRLGRVFPGDVARKLPGAELTDEFRNPARELDRLEQRVVWRFLRKRYDEDADDLKSQKGRPEHEEFFRDASVAFPRLEK